VGNREELERWRETPCMTSCSRSWRKRRADVSGIVQ
jgi:hypothetical protein